MEEIKVGDVVRLKSGGPDMTVVGVISKELFMCNWFDGQNVKASHFPPEALQRASDKQEVERPVQD
ncbi:MAG TPA: DUF2158 domain-containing protein [Pyrinomonadaceae bacterium]|nr:DUF2158 domain-containing protein [Pyrinomonadaceae bacterium]